MKLRIKKLLISSIIGSFVGLVGCINHGDSGSAKLTVSLKQIRLNCDTTANERGRVIFTLDFNNQTDKEVVIASPDSIVNAQPKCFLISNNIFPDALELLVKNDPKGQSIVKNAKDSLNVVLEYDKLKYILSHYTNRVVSDLDVKTFLNSQNYSILYVQIKDSISYFVSKPSNIKCSCK